MSFEAASANGSAVSAASCPGQGSVVTTEVPSMISTKHLVAAAIMIGSTHAGWALSEVPNAGTRGLERLCVEFSVLDETPVSEFDSGIGPEVIRQLAQLGLPAVDFTGCTQRLAESGDLFVTVRGAPSASGTFWAYDVSLELLQHATLDRDPTQQLTSGVPTYRNVTVGLAATHKLEGAIRTAAVGLARSFAQIYQRENTRDRRGSL